MRLAEADPALARRISPDLPDIAAEAAFAADHEQAHTVADVLLRRTRLGLLDARRLCEPDAEGPRAVAARDGRPARLGRLARGTRAGGVARGGARGGPGAGGRSGGRSPVAAPAEEPSPTAPGAAPEEAA